MRNETSTNESYISVLSNLFKQSFSMCKLKFSSRHFNKHLECNDIQTTNLYNTLNIDQNFSHISKENRESSNPPCME